MNSVLINDKMINDAKSRVTGLHRTFEEVGNRLKESFGEKFAAQLIPDNLTAKEKDDTEKLAFEKYSSERWNWKK